LLAAELEAVDGAGPGVGTEAVLGLDFAVDLAEAKRRAEGGKGWGDVAVVDVDGLGGGGDGAGAEAGDGAGLDDYGGGRGGGEGQGVVGEVDVRDAGEDGDVVCGSSLLLCVVFEDW